MRIIFCMLLCTGFLSAQSEMPLLDMQNQKYDTSLEKLYQNRSVLRHSVNQVLESELEAADYTVGPGDIFKVAVFGVLENEFEFEVLPEGNVLIPTVGAIHVSGSSLASAKDKIKKAIKDNYIRAEVSVNLKGLRKFRVYYTGEVKAPGTYFAQGSDRLSDIVEVSVKPAETLEEVTSSLSDWADDTKIKITHKDGSENLYDLTAFYRLGDKSQNPYLQGGDIIFVPAIELDKAYVIIEGNVGFQGVHSLKTDETLFHFLTRVSALSKKSNLEKIILDRNGETTIFNILKDQEGYRTYKLEKGDKIIIPTIYDRVYVRGEVYTPGALPYLANYTAADYIGRAGALDSADDIEDVIIVRQASGKILRGPDIIIEKGDTIILPKRAREVFKDYMSILAPVISLAIATIALVSR